MNDFFSEQNFDLVLFQTYVHKYNLHVPAAFCFNLL